MKSVSSLPPVFGGEADDRLKGRGGKTSLLFLLLLCLSIWPAACAWFDSPQGAPSTPTVMTATATLESALAPTPVHTPVRSSITTLRLWLPPAFDPNQDNPAAQILKQRLEVFSQANPDVRIEVRIKAEQGPGGMLESLSAASAAAPQALPDLALLSRPLLESAALKGYLQPLNALTSSLDQPDWYLFARQMATLQTSIFGLPFAAEALAVVYRLPEDDSQALVPANWQELIETPGQLGFAANDPQGLALLAFYRSAGGNLRNEQGLPALDEEPLFQTLAFYEQAVAAGRFPVWISQTDNESQVWQAFEGRQADWALVWSGRYLNAASDSGLGLATLPIANQQPISLARGWAWTMVSDSPEQQAAGMRLVEFLTDPAFLSEWNFAAGYLPPRAGALASWPDRSQKALIEPLLTWAELLPADDLLGSLGPALRQAGLDVLRQQVTAAEAAKNAVEKLKTP